MAVGSRCPNYIRLSLHVKYSVIRLFYSTKSASYSLHPIYTEHTLLLCAMAHKMILIRLAVPSAGRLQELHLNLL